jgi:hypothetical protein
VADQRHKLALGNRQVDVAQCGEQALLGLEGLGDVLDLDVSVEDKLQEHPS